MKKKWLKKMAALLSAALLISMPGLPVKADEGMAEGGQTQTSENVEQTVRAVSGNDSDIIYPAPSMKWVDNWSLELVLPDEYEWEYGVESIFRVIVYKDGEEVYNWKSTSDNGYAVVPVYCNLADSGIYSFTGYFCEDDKQVSEAVVLERDYTAPDQKLGSVTATWHEGSVPLLSFPAIPHTKYYLVNIEKDGEWRGGRYWSPEDLDMHLDGTLWTNEELTRSLLSEDSGLDIMRSLQPEGAGEYRVTVRAISEDVRLYANGDTGPISELFVFDGIFGKIVTGDISKVKDGLTTDKVTEITYILPDGAQVSEADQTEIFSALKGKDKSLTLSFQSEDQSMEYQWTFNGTEIVDAAKNMNFQIIVDANVQEVIDCVDTSSLNEVDLAFLHEGELPGQATVTVNLRGKLGDARTAHLYYYNPDTKQLEVVAENLAVEGGCVAFPMSHCSNYILTAEMLKNLIPDREPAKPDPKPDTGKNAANNTVSVPTEVTASPAAAAVISYVVEPGDTLKKIAARFYGSREFWTKIYADNAASISNPNRIYAGQVLYIYLVTDTTGPDEKVTEELYTVQPGDSLWEIAKKLYGKGMLYSKIYEANKEAISSPRKLQVGQKIVVPQ